MKALSVGVVGLVLLISAPLVVVLLAVAGAGGGGGPVSAFCATDDNMATILATIRTVESGGN